MVSMYSHLQIVHIVQLIGIKTNGNYRNFVIFTCFVRSIMCYVYSNTKSILFHHWFGFVGCKSRGNYRNFDNVPPNFHRLAKSNQVSKFNTHIWSTLWHEPYRFYRCLTHHFTQNLPYKYNLIMGTPNHIYTWVWYGISIPNCHFLLYY